MAHPGRWLRHMAHLGQCTCQAPGGLSCSDLGKAKNACPTESVSLRSTWDPESEQLRRGKCMECRACFGQYPCRATWSLSGVDWGRTHRCELGQTLCGPCAARTLHMCQWYSVPPWDSPIAHSVKTLPAVQETRVWFLGWEDTLEKEMATYSSILAWRILWTEEPGRLQSMGSQEPDMLGDSITTIPPHNTTEQVSLNKWPPLPSCVRAEIRHWGDLRTEEAKINKEEGTALEVTGATDQNCVVNIDYIGRRKWQHTSVSLPGKSHGQRSLVGCSPWGHTESGMTERLTLNTKRWKGPVDLEKKYKLEKGTVWNWTVPALPTTALEKFLDIFLLSFLNLFIFINFIFYIL